MQTIKTTLTKEQIASQIVDIMERYYTGNMMDIHIGLDEDGDVDYGFDVHSDTSSVVLSLVETQGGWSFGEWEGDIEDEESWTEEQKQGLVQSFCDDWLDFDCNEDAQVEFI